MTHGERTCRKCRHHGTVNVPSKMGTSGHRWVCCVYILDTGHRRPCPGGKGCKAFEAGEPPRRQKPMALPRKGKPADSAGTSSAADGNPSIDRLYYSQKIIDGQDILLEEDDEACRN